MSSSSLFLRVALRRLARRASLGHVGEPTEEEVPALSVLPVALPPHVNTTRRLGTTSTYRPEATCLGSANCTRNVPLFVGSSSAIRPFHRTYSTGSVNSRNTVSGDASIVIVRSMTLVSTAMPAPPLFFLLRGGLQRAKARIPEVLEIRAQLRDRLGSRPVEALRAALALGHKVRLLEDAQVLRDRRPCHVEAACDLSNRELGQRHHPQDLAASGLRNRRERVHRVKRKH